MIPLPFFRKKSASVYLTFDDGPAEATTPDLLQLLREFEVRATFFVIGMRAELYPGLVHQAYEEGHEIANHSYSHKLMLFKSPRFYREEIHRTDGIIQNITGARPRLFRPPFGKFGPGLLRALSGTQHELALWSYSTRDFHAGVTSDTIYERLQKGCRRGQIILMHDGHSNSRKTLAALERLLHTLQSREVEFATLRA